MAIYIGGPLNRPKRALPFWVNECYNIIEQATQVKRPLVESTLDQRDASSFCGELRNRIGASDGVIALFLPDDNSTPIECAIAALSGKRVFVLTEDLKVVPRLLTGLPGVRVRQYGPATANDLKLFLLGTL
jgi:hypothetical protein